MRQKIEKLVFVQMGHAIMQTGLQDPHRSTIQHPLTHPSFSDIVQLK